MPRLRPPLTVALALGLGLGLLVAIPTAATSYDVPAAPSVARQADDNPLAGRTWGVYKGAGDQSWIPYTRAHGKKRKLLGKIALTPKAKWYGDWIPNNQIEGTVRSHIQNATQGNPETLVQLTVFRVFPWEQEACDRLPTLAEQRSYKQWIRKFAKGVGNAHAAIVLQPDGPFALCAPGGSLVPSQLVAYASRKFSALANTSVYIDAGASDWPDVDEALDILIPGGILHARGFALNTTHYATTADEIAFGAKLVRALELRGILGKHFVVNTAANGRGFNHDQYHGNNYDNAPVCKTKAQTKCVTLGIPPTTDVANPDWGLSATVNDLAEQYVDGYLWISRPWLYMQADPFVMKRALAVVRTSPY